MIWYASLWTRLSSRSLAHGAKGGDFYGATVGDNPISNSPEGGTRPSFGRPSPLFPSFAGRPCVPHETLCRIEGALFRRERGRFGVVRKAKNMCTTRNK